MPREAEEPLHRPQFASLSDPRAAEGESAGETPRHAVARGSRVLNNHAVEDFGLQTTRSSWILEEVLHGDQLVPKVTSWSQNWRVVRESTVSTPHSNRNSKPLGFLSSKRSACSTWNVFRPWACQYNVPGFWVVLRGPGARCGAGAWASWHLAPDVSTGKPAFVSTCRPAPEFRWAPGGWREIPSPASFSTAFVRPLHRSAVACPSSFSRAAFRWAPGPGKLPVRKES